MSECKNIVPKTTGNGIVPTFANIPCRSVSFVGLTDITVTQGESVDLASGVHAYDGDGHEVAFSYEPQVIDTSVPGEYIVTYTASGVGDFIRPYMCGDTALHMAECDYSTVTAERIITVESLSCFEFAFQLFPPLPMDDPHIYLMRNTVRNNCDITFAHSVMCHYGLFNVDTLQECETDVFGLTPEVSYFSSVYFTATDEELAQGYKDIEYTITASTGSGVTATDTATYRCIL